MREIYNAIEKMLDTHIQVNEQAMNVCHSIGYNGFKRLHRLDAKQFACWRLELMNEMYDKHRTVLTPVRETVKYAPASLKEHLASWDDLLEKSIQELVSLHKDYVSNAGCESKLVKRLLKHFMKRYEKTGRWYARFEETSWLAHDCHVLDDRIHSRCKEVE